MFKNSTRLKIYSKTFFCVICFMAEVGLTDPKSQGWVGIPYRGIRNFMCHVIWCFVSDCKGALTERRSLVEHIQVCSSKNIFLKHLDLEFCWVRGRFAIFMPFELSVPKIELRSHAFVLRKPLHLTRSESCGKAIYVFKVWSFGNCLCHSFN